MGVMSIPEQYEAARKELLDLGLRNSLLNFRHSPARGIRVHGERSVDIFQILALDEKAMTFVPRKGLEVDLSPHLTNARRRLEDLSKWPQQIVEPAQLGELLKSLVDPINRVLKDLKNLPPRIQSAIDNASSPENEGAGRLLLDEVELAIHQAERVVARISRGQEILKGNLEANEANYISKSLDREIKVLASDHLARVEDAATGSSLRKEWLKPLTEKELHDTKLQTSDTDSRLQHRLLTTYHAARTYIEERGHNVLFLALGMLHWREEDDLKRDLKAPLLLLPVKLERAAVRERYKLSFTGDDIEGNLSLAEKLKQEFAIDLPEFPQVEDLDPKAYFEAVRKKVSSQKNWTVEDDEIYLGFFSFSKLMMFRDLDCGCWPKEEQPVEHPLLRAVLDEGFNEPGSAYDDATMLDDCHSPHDSYEVMDADSSQLITILDVRDGRNIVIQGPPGTGKSQTITNLLAQALGQNKRVLFVAEKMAALDVVKRRMDQVGLGDACLEVHSHNANKKAIVNELKRTLNQGRVIETANAKSDLDLLARLRSKLNEYAQAVNAPLAQTGYSAYEILGELIHQQRQLQGLTGLPRPRSMMESLSDSKIVLNCTRADLEERTVMVGRLQEHLNTLGLPVEHPFHGASLTMVLPTDRDQLAIELPKALEAIRKQVKDVAALRDRLGFGAQAKWADAKRLANMATRAADAPDVRGFNLRTRVWEDEEVALRELSDAGNRFSKLHTENDKKILPESWGRDVLLLRSTLLEHGEKWYKFVIGDYRRVRTEVRALCRAGYAPRDSTTLLKICETIMEEKRLHQAIEAKAELGSSVFGKQWRGADSDWPKLKTLSDFTISLREAVRKGEVDTEFLDFLETNPDSIVFPGLVSEMENAHVACKAELSRIFDLLKFDKNVREVFVDEWEFDRQVKTVETMISNPERLDEQVFYNQLAEEMRKAGLGWVLDGASEWKESVEHLVHWFRNTWFERLLQELLDQREPIRRFNQTTHAQDISRFRELDQLLFLFNRIKLAASHWEALPSMVGNGQLGILMREFEKRVRHLPIRRLMSEAGRAIQAIKPIFMMSPMSIASFLPKGSMKFDLVIFDEASQVKPVDALGAILRGKQLVVVGDSKQMPPTRFFDSIGNDDHDEDNRLADLESILGTMTGQRAPQRMLRWHYRSRHESLIAVSNQEFYHGKLVIFPNSNPADPSLGIKYHYLPDTVYERGGSSTNVLEARALAEAVFRHAREFPKLTLGVAAFSVKQMQAVLDEVERMRMEDNTCEEFFGAHPNEPFFVKNLENVQGDERDVIYISVGYGKGEDKKVSMNFGPLNSEGGERRLNVLITRARRRCEIFTNLRALDIDLTRSSARGVEVLKTYLQYAETGILEDEAKAAAAGVSTIFEEEVEGFLRENGHEVKLKVGEAGFFIDLAIADPANPGAYLLGIECDGPEYNRARTARDRDRTRQSVLEGLGWCVYRLWSVEWFAHPAQEKERLLAAIQAAKDGKPISADVTTEEADQLREKRLEELRHVRRESTSAKLTGTMSQPEYKLAKPLIRLGKKELIEQPSDKLVKWITEIVQIESPIHRDETYSRFLSSAGKRTGTRNNEAFEKGLAQAVSEKSVTRDGDFLFDPTQEKIQIRDRRRLSSNDRKFELVANAELDAAIILAVRQSYGVATKDISIASSRLLGFSRTLEPMRQRVDERVTALIADGELIHRTGQIQTPD